MTTATAAELESAWAERVRANRAQVDQVREVPDRDFYAPVSSLFVADPRRTGEEALDALVALIEPGDRWLDIGAGAGRYALPLAIRAREVIAVEPSASMRNALRMGKEEHGLANLRIVPGTWPEILATLGKLTDDAAGALAIGDVDGLGRTFDAAHGLLCALRVSGPELDTLVHTARAAGAIGAKLTGAGGGGAVIALAPGHERDVLARWKAAGFDGFLAEIAATPGAGR